MSDATNVAHYLQPGLEGRIQSCNREIATVYKKIQRTLTAPNFDKSLSGLRFSSMEKEELGRIALDTGSWFRSEVKKAAVAAGMTPMDTEIYWNKIYCALASAMPEVTYVNISDIDAITSTRMSSRQASEPAEESDYTELTVAGGAAATALAVTSILTKNPKIRAAATIGSALVGYLGSGYTRAKDKLKNEPATAQMVEETCIDETALQKICEARKAEVSSCVEHWLRGGGQVVSAQE